MKKILSFVWLTVATVLGVHAQDSYIVAGVNPLCDSYWDGNDETNKMTTSDNINYTLVKEGRELEKGVNYEYKIVKNGSTWIGENGGSANAKLTVDENGKYTITFTYSTATNTPQATAVKTGDAEFGDKIWTVAGEPSAVFGALWDQTNSDNDMVAQADGTFLLEKKGIALTATTVKFKVLANHNWTENYGNGSENFEISIQEDGVYDFAFTFNPTSKVVGGSATKVGDYTGEKVYTVGGDFVYPGEDQSAPDITADIFGYGWSETNTDNDMTKGDDGKFYLNIDNVFLPVGTIRFLVILNHNWDESYGIPLDNGGKDNVTIDITEEGDYNLTFIFDPTTKEVSGSAYRPEKTFTVAGWCGSEFSDATLALFGAPWDVTLTSNDMTEVENFNFILRKENITLPACQIEYKIVSNHSWDESYGVNGENIILDVAEPGTYDVEFQFSQRTRISTVTLTKVEETAIQSIENVSKPTVFYNIAGQRLSGNAAKSNGIIITDGKKIIIK